MWWQQRRNPTLLAHSHARKLVGWIIPKSGYEMLVRGLSSKITPVKEFLKAHVDHPIANTAVRTAEALGYGITGAGILT
jgi:hypothetical protein